MHAHSNEIERCTDFYYFLLVKARLAGYHQWIIYSLRKSSAACQAENMDTLKFDSDSTPQFYSRISYLLLIDGVGVDTSIPRSILTYLFNNLVCKEICTFLPTPFVFSGQFITEGWKHTEEIYTLVALQNGAIASGGEEGSVKVFDPYTGNREPRPMDTPPQCEIWDICPIGTNWVAIAYYPCNFLPCEIFDTITWEKLFQLEIPSQAEQLMKVKLQKNLQNPEILLGLYQRWSNDDNDGDNVHLSSIFCIWSLKLDGTIVWQGSLINKPSNLITLQPEQEDRDTIYDIKISAFRVLANGNIATGSFDGTLHVWPFESHNTIDQWLWGCWIACNQNHSNHVMHIIELLDGRICSVAYETMVIWKYKDVDSAAHTILVPNGCYFLCVEQLIDGTVVAIGGMHMSNWVLPIDDCPYLRLLSSRKKYGATALLATNDGGIWIGDCNGGIEKWI